jgi:hypothetical protein
MTQARTLTPGLGNPPLIQLLLEAVLCAFVRLVQGVVATLGMRFNRTLRDWHTNDPQEALPQAKPDIQLEEPTTPTESCSGLSRASLLDPARELANDPREAINQDARHKAEHDAVDVAASRSATSLLSFRAKPRTGSGGSAVDPEPRGDARSHLRTCTGFQFSLE